MRSFIVAILFLLPTLTFAVPSKHVLTGKVVKVTDGDTITILTADNAQERVRLWGIDAPEQRGGQPFWRASRDELAKLVAGKTVTITWTPLNVSTRRVSFMGISIRTTSLSRTVPGPLCWILILGGICEAIDQTL